MPQKLFLFDLNSNIFLVPEAARRDAYTAFEGLVEDLTGSVAAEFGYSFYRVVGIFRIIEKFESIFDTIVVQKSGKIPIECLVDYS